MTDFINEAQQVLRSGQSNLTTVLPALITRIIKDQLWIGQRSFHGHEFKTFRQFVEDETSGGLRVKYNVLMDYCKHDTECTRLLKELEPELAKQGGDGSNQYSKKENSKGSNTTLADRGSTYTLRRLKRDRPDLAQKVIGGDLSAHAAAIEAGFRKRMVQVEPTAEGFLKAMHKHLNTAEIKILIESIGA
jgi:hypothetical protein